MNEPFIVGFTPRASREVAEAKRWWRANRTKAPDALEQEIRTGLQLISTTPGMVKWHATSRFPAFDAFS